MKYVIKTIFIHSAINAGIVFWATVAFDAAKLIKKEIKK